MRRLLVIATCLFLLCTFAVAGDKPLRLDPSQAMTQYVMASWRDTSGLPVDSVAGIAQTPDGYLWIATEHGLVRFDGMRFTVFTRQNTSVFRSHDIFTLFVSRDGTLWIGTRGGGALTLRDGRFSRVPTHLRYIIEFAESGDGAVWIGAPGGLARFHESGSAHFGKEQGYPGGNLLALAGDGTGVYASFPGGLFRVAPGQATQWPAKEGLSANPVTSLLLTSGGLLAGTKAGDVQRLAEGRFETLIRTGCSCAISSMIEGAAGSLWMSTIGSGVLRYTNGTISSLTAKEGLTSDSVNQLLEDDEGNIWAATIGGGVARLKAGRITNVETRQPLSGEWVLPLLQARDGSVWFATNGGGLNRLQGDSVTRLAREDGRDPGIIGAIAEGRDGTIWVGSEHGLQRVSGNRTLESVRDEELRDARIFAITTARDGSLWVSANKGLFHITGGVARKLTEKDGITPGAIVAIREAADGSLWLARPAAVEHLVDGKLTRYNREDGLKTAAIYSIAIDEKDGSVWVATAGDGLSRIRQGRVRTYRASDGLLTDSAYGIVQDHDGNLWIPTGLGLYTIKRSVLDRFDAGQIDTLRISVFGKSDGLKSSDFSGGFDRPGFRASDGRLWFPTTRGLVRVNPAGLRLNPNPPRLLIESLVADGASWLPHDVKLDLVRGKRNIEIAYTAPSFDAPEATTFRYKLEGFDDAWREVGGRRTAYFTNLPPGKYRFRVQATNAAGISTEAATRLELAPRIYEMPLFKVAAGLLLLLLLLVAYRRRVEAMDRRQAELQQSEEHFRSLIENGADMILVVGIDQRISYMSPSVARSLDLQSMKFLFEDLLMDREQGDAFLAAVRSQGLHSAVLPFRDETGQRRDVEAVGAVYEDRGAIILNCRDITSRRKLESQLEQATRLAGLGRLAATVSHEFNNVLMGIQPFVEIINRSSPDRMTQKAMTHIAKSIKRGKRISEEILTFTRPVETTRRPIPVRDWLADLEIEIRALVGPNVRVAIVAADGLTLDGDAGQLNQVLTNLAINARDAGATAIRLDASWYDGDGNFAFGIVRNPQQHAHLRFLDNGAGIPESILPNIFEPLFTTKTSKGTGLGLAVAQKVIASHGGEMFVESKVGNGTTFHMFLPISVSAGGELLTGEDIARPPDTATCRILLVEDDSSVAEGILTLLQSEGFDVDLAINGNDALSIIPRFAPDIVILDVGLPDIGGVELYQRIMKKWPQIRIMFSTGHGDVDTLQEHLLPPLPICLRKPYSVDELLAAIAALTGAAPANTGGVENPVSLAPVQDLRTAGE